MKKFFSLLLCGAIVIGLNSCKEDEFKAPGGGPNNNNNTPQEDTKEAVDLALSVRWATCNIGAAKPEEYGKYFAWGETRNKDTFNWLFVGDYRWGVGKPAEQPNFGMTKYNKSDNKTVLEAADDAATAKWGEEWRMPTAAEQQELLDKCIWTWTTRNGVNGYEVKGRNGNAIFLPAAGYCNFSDVGEVGEYGYYWSASRHQNIPMHASHLLISTKRRSMNTCDRYIGLTIRPVFIAE